MQGHLVPHLPYIKARIYYHIKRVSQWGGVDVDEGLELTPFPKLRRKLKLRKQTEKVLNYSIAADCDMMIWCSAIPKHVRTGSTTSVLG